MTSLLDYNVALFLFVTLSLWPEINAIIIFGSTVIANFVFKSLNGNPETGKKRLSSSWAKHGNWDNSLLQNAALVLPMSVQQNCKNFKALHDTGVAILPPPLKNRVNIHRYRRFHSPTFQSLVIWITVAIGEVCNLFMKEL